METRKKTGRKIVDVAVRGCSLVATVLALALMGWILWTVVREGAGALSWDLLIHRSRPYGEPGGGIANALVGTLVITLGETAPLLFTALYADDWPTNYFGGPTPSIPVLIANNTLDSPFEEVQRVGWSAALVIAGAILAFNVAVRFFARPRREGRS